MPRSLIPAGVLQKNQELFSKIVSNDKTLSPSMLYHIFAPSPLLFIACQYTLSSNHFIYCDTSTLRLVPNIFYLYGRGSNCMRYIEMFSFTWIWMTLKWKKHTSCMSYTDNKGDICTLSMTRKWSLLHLKIDKLHVYRMKAPSKTYDKILYMYVYTTNIALCINMHVYLFYNLPMYMSL